MLLDNISKEKRSKIMSCIRSKNTKPEITIRKMIWSKGFRYRIHNRSVFGTPDISNRSRNIAVFVDGCFWHGCPRCYKEPKTNVDFWRSKIIRNRARRDTVKKQLRKEGWRVLEFWEHHINKDPQKVVLRITNKINKITKNQ